MAIKPHWRALKNYQWIARQQLAADLRSFFEAKCGVRALPVGRFRKQHHFHPVRLKADQRDTC
jgi:hypothetical protein